MLSDILGGLLERWGKPYKDNPLYTDREMPRKDPESRAEYNRQYRTDHYEEFKERKNVCVDCECGGHYTTKMKARHTRTKLHQDFVAKH